MRQNAVYVSQEVLRCDFAFVSFFENFKQPG